MIMKNERYCFYKDVKPQDMGGGVVRRVLAYSKDLMAVENTFEKGAVGALHHHPHTQITYVVSGAFEFEIDGKTDKGICICFSGARIFYLQRRKP